MSIFLQLAAKFLTQQSPSRRSTTTMGLERVQTATNSTAEMALAFLPFLRGYLLRTCMLSCHHVSLWQRPIAEQDDHWLIAIPAGSMITNRSCSPPALSTHKPMTMDPRLDQSTTPSNRLPPRPKSTIASSSQSSCKNQAAAFAPRHQTSVSATPV